MSTVYKPQDLLPSYKETRLDFPILPNYIATNASVVVEAGLIYVLVPAMDHYVCTRGVFLPLPVGTPEPRVHYAKNATYLARLNDDLSVNTSFKLDLPPDQVPRTAWPFRGFESPRLFAWKEQLWMTLCTHGCGRCEGAEFYIGRISERRFTDVRRITTRPPPPLGSVEKNWMPEVNGTDLRFHHRLGTLIDLQGNLTHLTSAGTDPDLSHYHGGSQVIPYKDGKLCVVHHYHGGLNESHQRFVRLDNAGHVIAASQLFNLHRDITTGMAYHPDGKRMILSYGRQDAEPNVLQCQEKPYLATVELDDLGRLL